MKRIWLAFFLFLVFSLNAFAAIVVETRLSETGFADFVVEGPENEDCRELEFLKPQEFSQETYPVFSLHASFLPVPSRESTATVSLNGKEVEKIRPEEFVNGFARIDLPKEMILEKNKLVTCLKNSFATTKSVFLADSMLGYYLKPDFSAQGAFTVEYFPKKPRLFEEMKVRAIIKNYGSEGTDIALKYRKDSLEKETPETELVRGKTSFKTFVDKCMQRSTAGDCVEPSTASFEFFLRPKVLGTITLLPAIVEFENEFGEKETIESNRPDVKITEPEIKLRTFIKSEKKELFAKDPAFLRLVVVNDGTSPLYNVTVKIESPGLSIKPGQATQFFDYIGEKAVLEREFSATAVSTGAFEIGCSATYLDSKPINSNCEKAVIEFKNTFLTPQMLSVFLLVIISFAAFVYIFYVKK